MGKQSCGKQVIKAVSIVIVSIRWLWASRAFEKGSKGWRDDAVVCVGMLAWVALS